MTPELYTLMLLEIAALAALLLLSALVYRANPKRWLLRWNLSWTVYLLHLPVSFSEALHPAGPAARLGASQFISIAAEAALVASMASLTGRRHWEKRIWFAFAMVEAAGSGMLAMGWHTGFEAAGAVSILLTFGLAAPLVLIHALSRRTPGSWLMLAALPLRLAHFKLTQFEPLHLYDTLAAIFMMVAGLLIVLEEFRESRQWRSAVMRFSAAMAAAGGQEVIDKFCENLSAISGARSVKLLDAPLEPDRGGSAKETAKDHVRLPLEAGGVIAGTLLLTYNRSLPGSPVDPDLLVEMGQQIAVTLRGSQVTARLTRSHREWLTTIDSIRDYILVHDNQYRIERVNRALADVTDLPVSQLVGHNCREVLPGAGERWRHCPFCEATSEDQYAEQFNPDFGGHFLISTSRNEIAANVLHVVRNVSARRAAEERYRYIFENVREGVFMSTPEGLLVDCNEGLARMLGYSRKELLSVHIPTTLWMDPLDRQRQVEIMEAEGHLEDFEVLLRRKDGETLVGLETSFATRNSTGRVVSYQGFIVDVTERKRAEEELRHQNEILSAMNRLAQQMTYRLDRQEVLHTVVEEIRRVFHFDLVAVYLIDEVTGMSTRTAAAGFRTEQGRSLQTFRTTPTVIDLLRRGGVSSLFPSSDLGILAPEVRAVRELEQIKSTYAMPIVGEHLLGVISFSNRAERTLSLAEENLLGAISRQVNNVISNTMLYEQSRKAYEDLRLAQEQLLQTQKLAAIGQLVSGVAHELNNPLAAIIGYSQLLSTHVSPKGADYLDKLMRQARRTQKIIQDLLTFSRQKKPERLVLDLNAVVEGALLLREYDINANHLQVQRDLAQNLPSVVGDRHQLEQAFLNIINNACDAILEVEGAGLLEVRSYAAGKQIFVEFHDDGVGMKEPNRVFEPFYTTKKVGMGTGLGLSICYGIVKEHGGEIEAEGREPRGSIFRVKLPARAREAPDEQGPGEDLGKEVSSKEVSSNDARSAGRRG